MPIACIATKPSKFRRKLINSVEEDYAFAKNKAAQLQMLKEAFETGDDYKIDQALLTVQYARDSLRNGILEMTRDYAAGDD